MLIFCKTRTLDVLVASIFVAATVPAFAFEQINDRPSLRVIASAMGKCIVIQRIAYNDRDAHILIDSTDDAKKRLPLSAGGVGFANGALDFSYPEITREALADCLEISPSEIVGLTQNGADGLFKDDNYMGFTFEVVSGANTNDPYYESGITYRFELGNQECSRIHCFD